MKKPDRVVCVCILMYLSVTQNQGLEDIPRDVDLVTMGINPSKSQLHLGHYLTMYQMFRLMADRPETRGLIFVDDREYDWGKFCPNGYTLPGKQQSLHVGEAVRSFVEKSQNQLPCGNLARRVNIRHMSRFVGKRENPQPEDVRGEDIYRLIYDNRDAIAERFPLTGQAETDFNTVAGGLSLLRPQCPNCECLPINNIAVDYRYRAMQALCPNRCAPEKFVADIGKGDMNWAMHYTIDPIRDVALARRRDVGVAHVFGGDYGMPWGPGSMPKAQRLSWLIRQIAPDVTVHHYTGPMIIKEGRKLAKSNGDRCEEPELDTLEMMLGKPRYEVA